MHILPVIDELNAPYWAGTAAGELRLQRCRHCRFCWHPPLPGCPNCSSQDVEWSAAAGTGTLYSFTDVHHPVHAGLADWVPYRICLVDLDEGLRIISGMTYTSEEPAIGAKVSVFFKRINDEVTLPFFELTPSAA